MRKVCKHCGKELTGKRTSYCNDGCRKGYENGKNYQRKCRHCGEYFIGSRTGYTCPKCLSTIRKNKHKYKSKCIVCGKEFVGSKSKKYCSRSCQNKNASVNICEYCGEEFKGRYNAKYCSDKCMKNGNLIRFANNKLKKIKNIKEKHINLLIEESDLLDFDFDRSYKFKCIKNHTISMTPNKLLKLDKIECEKCNYELKPNFCIECGNILDFDNRKNKYCSRECHEKNIKDFSFNEQSEFNYNHSETIINLLNRGYSELKIIEITKLNYTRVKNFILEHQEEKNNLTLLEDELISLLNKNNKIDLKSLGFTKIASQFIKNKYNNFLEFMNVNNINVKNKLFKCNRCEEYYEIDQFSLKKSIVKGSYFGIGRCKHCSKVEKIKRRSRSSNLDSKLTSKYINYIKKTFNNRCALCGDNHNIHIDHFIPLAWGMDNPIKGNYILLCDKCNSVYKRDLNYIDWINKYNDESFYKKLEIILDWLSKENNMNLDDYKDLYWKIYNNYVYKKINRKI